jgi:hypothetical protein
MASLILGRCLTACAKISRSFFEIVAGVEQAIDLRAVLGPLLDLHRPPQLSARKTAPLSFQLDETPAVDPTNPHREQGIALCDYLIEGHAQASSILADSSLAESICRQSQPTPVHSTLNITTI